MLLIDLRTMRAANAAINPKLLPAGTGADARNLDISQGDFRGMRGLLLAHTLTGVVSQAASIYRMGRDTASDTAYWLATTADADYARSLLATDPTERTYITGGGGVPRYTDNTYLGTAPYPTATVSLGVPAPTGGMTLTLGTPGTGPTETRTYTQTFLRANLDESAPDTTASTIDVPGGSTVDITGLPAAPGGSHGITLRRIYVSTGTTEFQRLASQAVATTTATDDGVTRGEILQTGGSTSKPTWLTPPDAGFGMIELWGGMHGMLEGKAYRVCVQFNPHAWPVEYRRQVPDTIVGSAAWGENWLLATTGLPRVVNGSTPAGMIARPIVGFKQACVSKRSVKSVGHGVCWASNDGLAYHGQRGTKILTDGILTKAQWRALVPSTITGASWGRWYIGFYNDGTRRSFMIDTVEPAGIIWSDVAGYGVFEDSISETLFVLGASNIIRKWDYGTQMEATYKSAVYAVPSEANAGCVRIVASAYPVRFTLWADEEIITYQMDVFDDEPVRLPGGYVARNFQVQIQAKGPVEGVFVGTEFADLP
jgi:hypothetical protein